MPVKLRAAVSSTIAASRNASRQAPGGQTGGGGAEKYDAKKSAGMDGVLKRIYKTESDILNNMKTVETDKVLMA